MKDRNKPPTAPPRSAQSEHFCGKWQKMKEKCRYAEAPARQSLQDFIQLIETHYKNHHLCLFYARQLKMSPGYLRRICRSALGCTPGYCIHLRIMAEACHLLKHSALPVKNITYDLGFKSPAYFSRFFKKWMNIPPATWRKQLSPTLSSE